MYILSETKYITALSFSTRLTSISEMHCVKSVRIRSYFWSVFCCIQSELRKTWIRNNSVFGHFLRSDDIFEEREVVVRRCSVKINVLKNFSRFPKKKSCWSFFFNKVIGCWPESLLRRDLGTSVFQ